MSPDEQHRASRFVFDIDREHYTVGRGLLRRLLGQYLDLRPEELMFSYGPKDKPALSEALHDIAPLAETFRFNLSHSGGLALYGFTVGRELGVDIEYIRELKDAESIATHYFAPGEVRVFCALPEEQKRLGFFNCWSRKESYIKATGDGLSMPLDRFEVSLLPGEPAQFLSVDGDPTLAERWMLRELYPASDYAAAICVEAGVETLRCWSWGAS